MQLFMRVMEAKSRHPLLALALMVLGAFVLQGIFSEAAAQGANFGPALDAAGAPVKVNFGGAEVTPQPWDRFVGPPQTAAPWYLEDYGAVVPIQPQPVEPGVGRAEQFFNATGVSGLFDRAQDFGAHLEALADQAQAPGGVTGAWGGVSANLRVDTDFGVADVGFSGIKPPMLPELPPMRFGASDGEGYIAAGLVTDFTGGRETVGVIYPDPISIGPHEHRGGPMFGLEWRIKLPAPFMR